MILNDFLPKFVHLHGQQFSGVFEKFSCTSSFLVKNAKKKTINVFLSKMIYQIKMQAATNWSSHLKKNQIFGFFQTTNFYAIFKNHIFRDF